MLYCSKCGVGYHTEDSICHSCGNPIINESKSYNMEKETIGIGLEATNEYLNHEIALNDSNPSSKEECHLGKGLIKPHSVDLEIDGFHFKYDKPARSIAKSEAFKDKVVEFRVTSPELPAEPKSDLVVKLDNEESIVSTVSPIENLEKTIEEEIPESESKDEINPIQECINNNQELWVADEVLNDSINEACLENEPVSISEPELEIVTDGKVLWEDFSRWLGIPIAKRYRIFKNTLQISDSIEHRFSEVDLQLISEVKLRKSWWDKLMGIGDLVISVKNIVGTPLVLSGIRRPETVQRLFEDLIHSDTNLPINNY